MCPDGYCDIMNPTVGKEAMFRQNGGARPAPLKMRQTYKQEMLYLAELCGLEVMDIFGDDHGSREDTGRYVWLLRKKR